MSIEETGNNYVLLDKLARDSAGVRGRMGRKVWRKVSRYGVRSKR